MDDDVRVPPAAATPELHGPYLNAPTWPWLVAGWLVCAVFVLFFVLAWSRA